MSGSREKLQAIFFDFDGVILESVDIKTDAFRELFENYPEHLAAITKLHVENGGMSRFEKFRIIYRDMLGVALTSEDEDRLGNRFSEIVFRRILECPFVAGAREFLERWAGIIDLYVVSGTPIEEMRKIVGLRNLDFAFKGVFGSPEKKEFWTSKVIEEKGYAPERCCFVGDAGTDLRAARESRTRFVGRVAQGAYDPFAGEGDFPRLADMTGLASVLGLADN